jgi:hypothetical protein
MDTRRDQMFPVLDAEDLERVRRFGQVHAYQSGEAADTPVCGPGATVLQLPAGALPADGSQDAEVAPEGPAYIRRVTGPPLEERGSTCPSDARTTL